MRYDDRKTAVCSVCPNRCVLQEGQYGRCYARKNENGTVICANYGKITSLALDPIEKKPLRHFLPGSMILSAGSFGCNLACPFCQNYEISMKNADEAVYRQMNPQQLAELAKQLRSQRNIGLAFTYNEPLVGYEFVRDTARIIHEHGMKNVLVTNGTACLPVIEELLPYIDAMNIDLKGFTEEYYKKLGGNLKTVKDFIRRASKECHVELTTLIIPGENDSEEEMCREAEWIASVDPDIVLHITRFFPRYHMTDREATEISTIYRLCDAASGYLRYVYAGNC